MGPTALRDFPLHRAFFERLSSVGEESVEWRAAFAGLITLRYLDACVDGNATDTDLSGDRQGAERALALLPSTVTERVYLAGMVDVAVPARGGAGGRTRLVSLLFAYGKALERQKAWALAADVFVSAHEISVQVTPVSLQGEFTLVAVLRAGLCYRELGDTARAARCFGLIIESEAPGVAAHVVLEARSELARLKAAAPGVAQRTLKWNGNSHASPDAPRPEPLASDVTGVGNSSETGPT